MRYVYAAIIVLFATTVNAYDNLVPQYNKQIIVIDQTQVPTVTQTMVYYTPYFTVTVPVQVTIPVAVAQPAQHTVYWGYPYQSTPINYYWHRQCRIFNY